MRSLRIGIDGYNIAMPHGTGVATYGRVLATMVRRMGHSPEGLFGLDLGTDPALAEILFYERLNTPARRRRKFFRSRLAGWLPAAAPSIVEVNRPGLVDTMAFDHRLPHFDRVLNGKDLFEFAHRSFRRTGRVVKIDVPNPPDIMHWTYPIPIAMNGTRNIYTIHDLVPLRLPHTTLDDKAFYRKLIGACIESADRICTVSEASLKDIETLFPNAVGRAINTYQASELQFEDRDTFSFECSVAETAFGLEPSGYFLFFGAIEPKKNIGRLIEAYLGLKTSTPLVIVSGRSWQSAHELVLVNNAQKIGGNSLGRRIVQLDFMTHSVLVDLIRHAKAVVFPSLYEGFGLPVHESMLLGTAVLSSKAGSLPEITGGHALEVDPYEVSSIRAGLASLDRDPRLREDLAKRGQAHAKSFSVSRYQDAIEKLYKSVPQYE